MNLKLSRHQKAIIALVIANIIWGAASPIFKWSLDNIHPFTLAFFRFWLAALILLPFAWNNLKVEKKDWHTLIILSISGITFNISFFFLGLSLAPSINAPIIATSGPIFLLMGCWFYLKEKIKKKIIFGTLIGFLGVSLIILQPLLENGFDGEVLGNLFFVLATIGAVIHTVFARKIMPHYSAVTITFWSFFIGALTFAPFFSWETGKYGLLAGISYVGITGIVFGVVLCSVAAYYLFNLSIKMLQAQEVGVFAYLDPIVAIIIAIPLLGEIPTPLYILGSLFVLVGILTAEGRFSVYRLLKKWKEEIESPNLANTGKI
ncbi:MAG: DMT family transporter [bacterium]|nr:DMT family transporter [bacterium]